MLKSNFPAMRFPNSDSSRRTESNEAVTHDTSCSSYEQDMRDTEMRFSSHPSMRLNSFPRVILLCSSHRSNAELSDRMTSHLGIDLGRPDSWENVGRWEFDFRI
jgi:hypothetical protein